MYGEEQRSVLDPGEVDAVDPRCDVERGRERTLVCEECAIDQIRGVAVVCVFSIMIAIDFFAF